MTAFSLSRIDDIQFFTASMMRMARAANSAASVDYQNRMIHSVKRGTGVEKGKKRNLQLRRKCKTVHGVELMLSNDAF